MLEHCKNSVSSLSDTIPELDKLAERISDMLVELEAVSYTHLDVYKRQPILEVVFIPVTVQGAYAPSTLIKAYMPERAGVCRLRKLCFNQL